MNKSNTLFKSIFSVILSVIIIASSVSCAFAAVIVDEAEKEMYFGAITAQLHNTLLNEPKPYRQDVKQLLSNLLNWVTELGSPEIGIDRPNHSQRVYLKHSSEREVL